MICVSLGHSRATELLREHRALCEQGVSLVEWRLDYLQEPVPLAELCAARPGPVICTLRRPEDGGFARGPELERRAQLAQVIAAGVEYVDLEEDAAWVLPRSGPTKRIVSAHDFQGTPGDLAGLHAKLAAPDADVVKIATLANRLSDGLRMLQFVGQQTRPTVGLCMGELGMPTRILNGKYGSPWTYAAPCADRPLAPGQLSFVTLRDEYRYPRLTRATRVLGVIGDPIQHSYSPLLHNAALRQTDLDVVYLPFRVSEDELPEFLTHLADWDLDGLSVTIPHKEAILASLTTREDAVVAAGAANTIFRRGTNLHGYNFDIAAAVAALETAFPDAHEESGPPRSHEPRSHEPRNHETRGHDWTGQQVLILGAGGAARAIGYGLQQRGADVWLTSRTPARAEEVAARIGGRTLSWAERGEFRGSVIVNCTPVGMSPHAEESPFEARWLRPSQIVFDTVYNPEETLLLRMARQVGCPTVGGIEMFIRQAAAQFQVFTGRAARLATLRDVLRKALAARARA